MKLPLHLITTLSLIACAPSFANTVDNDFKLGAGDRVQIIVYGEEDLSIESLFINSNGAFDYPYLGRLSALNKTPEQLKNEITNGLKGDYLISPKVSVNIVEFRSIYINGEVKKPGGYEYQPGLTVDKAIALAGGFTDRASREKIYKSESKSHHDKSKVQLTTKVSPGEIIVVEQTFF